MPEIRISESVEGWTEFAANIIGEKIHQVIVSKGSCNLMLTGGKTAEKLYRHYSETDSFPKGQVDFYFGDERCVSPEHIESNYRMVVRTLFKGGLAPEYSLHRMEAEHCDHEVAAKRYEMLLPEVVDVLLLGMGTDGHIASLFPRDAALHPRERCVLPVKGPKSPYNRLTITPRVIECSESVFLLVTGKEKGSLLAEALQSSSDFVSLPVRLTMDGTWLIDNDAERGLINNNKV